MALSAAPGSLGGAGPQPASNRRDEVMREVAGPGEGMWFGRQDTTARPHPRANEQS